MPCWAASAGSWTERESGSGCREVLEPFIHTHTCRFVVINDAQQRMLYIGLVCIPNLGVPYIQLCWDQISFKPGVGCAAEEVKRGSVSAVRMNHSLWHRLQRVTGSAVTNALPFLLRIQSYIVGLKASVFHMLIRLVVPPMTSECLKRKQHRSSHGCANTMEEGRDCQ